MITFEEAKVILTALEREGVDYILVGSMGMAAQGLVRATKDIDLFVRPANDNVERLRRALRALYDDPAVDEITSHDLAGDYPAVEYTPPHQRYSMDILARLGDAFDYDSLDAEDVEVDGIRIRVATPTTLYHMKKGTVRLQDRADAEWIRDVFGLQED